MYLPEEIKRHILSFAIRKRYDRIFTDLSAVMRDYYLPIELTEDWRHNLILGIARQDSKFDEATMCPYEFTNDLGRFLACNLNPYTRSMIDKLIKRKDWAFALARNLLKFGTLEWLLDTGRVTLAEIENVVVEVFTAEKIRDFGGGMFRSRIYVESFVPYKKMLMVNLIDVKETADILIKHIDLYANWDFLSGMDREDFIEANLDKINWIMFASNQASVKLIEKYMDRLDWSDLSANPYIIRFLEQNEEKIEWEFLSMNAGASRIIERNLDKISWDKVNQNSGATGILSRNQDRVVPNLYARNTEAYPLTGDRMVKFTEKAVNAMSTNLTFGIGACQKYTLRENIAERERIKEKYMGILSKIEQK